MDVIVKYFYRALSESKLAFKTAFILLMLFCISLPGLLSFGKIPITKTHSLSSLSYFDPTNPLILKPAITLVNPTNITVEGEVLAGGAAVIVERGIIYSMISNSDQAESKIVQGSGIGKFTVQLSGLTTNKAYRLKVYAIIDGALTYGPEIQFNTFGAPRFTSELPGQADYGKDYQSIIKVESHNLFETTISAVTKPSWLNLRCEPLLSVFAGGAVMGTSNGIGNKARFLAPFALALDADGSVYLADQADNRIRKISTSGEVSTVAGTLTPGFKDGPASEARFDTPSGIAVDNQGNIYISDEENNSIRKISPSGLVVTFAGSQQAGLVNGKASDARFNRPSGICIDDKGNVYVADRNNHVIRVISPAGIVSTLAGSGKAGFAEGKGKNAKFNVPTGIAVDAAGNVYVADQVNNRIRKISPEGEVSTIAGNGQFSMRDGEANQAAFRYPTGLTMDSDLNIYVTDQLNHSIRRISSMGKVSTIATNKGSGTAGSDLKNPMGICLNKDGSLYVADYHHFQVKVITFDARLYGTPSKSEVGSHKVVLQATDEYGSTTLEGQFIVRDTIAPKIIAMVPASQAADVDSTATMRITFDEEISSNDAGVITLSSGDAIISTYTMGQGVNAKNVALSADSKSLVVIMTGLPFGAILNVKISNGIVKDKANNLYNKSNSAISAWSFSTKAKVKQSLDVKPIEAKIYGEPAFKIGPRYSSASLEIEYYAEDPGIVSINGDSVKILKAGTTKIIALQKGNKHYLEEKVSVGITIQPKAIIIKPLAGQGMTYGGTQSVLKYELASGSLANDTFTGELDRAKGDSVGFYKIIMGSLSLNSNYQVKLLNEAFEIRKAQLLVKAADQSKLSGAANPIFTGTFEGFVNGDGSEVLSKKPVFTTTATSESPLGTYPVNVSGAIAKNYTISYKTGTLNVVSSGSSEFTAQVLEFLENKPTGTPAARLKQNQNGNPVVFTLVAGEGDADNSSFLIADNSIVSVRPLDYEAKQTYSVRVKSDGAYGESSVKAFIISLKDVNEQPQMTALALESICANGTMKLEGISAGPEQKQNVKVFVKSLGSAKVSMEVSQLVNGVSIISYSTPANMTGTIDLQIVLKDDGGTLNGGLDSMVYNYTFKVNAQAPVQITSEKGTTLARGGATFLAAQGTGKFQWYLNDKQISGEQGRLLNITVNESGVYSMKVTSEQGCISEGKISISVLDSPPVTATNLISANSDGINDSFIVRNIEYYPKNELWIMDRTGKVVYNQKSYSNRWEGTFHGANLPVGTYYYILDLGNQTAKVKGYVSLVN